MHLKQFMRNLTRSEKLMPRLISSPSLVVLFSSRSVLAAIGFFCLAFRNGLSFRSRLLSFSWPIGFSRITSRNGLSSRSLISLSCYTSGFLVSTPEMDWHLILGLICLVSNRIFQSDVSEQNLVLFRPISHRTFICPRLRTPLTVSCSCLVSSRK